MATSRQMRRRVLQSILAGPVLAGLGPTIKAFRQRHKPMNFSSDV
jgi:hypothetical protein